METTKNRAGWEQLTQGKRDRMQIMLGTGEMQKDIAEVLKVAPSTISRERKRKKEEDGIYDADVAQQKAYVKRLNSKYQGMKVEKNIPLKEYVIRGLRQKRSPDEIAGRMKLEKLPFYASKKAIYQWLYSVYGEKYCKYLCTKRKRKRRQKKKTARVMIPNRKSIWERPLGATNKTRYRHFEGDTAVAPKNISNTNGIAVAAERMCKLFLAKKVPSMAPAEMTRAVNHFETQVNMLSMTIDNGIENKGHEDWPIPAYCADPYSPWQKPLIECTIGLLRRWFFKKGTDWSQVSEARLQGAVNFLNHKYRKSLGYQSAIEVAMAHGIMKKTNEDHV